mmetsp:Transcript_1533/g.3358  ORF Transcript_1533/g.3358 Transcript_1533/m.3358 type:complete len:242 (-) Transcript_1533:195-920(-)
MRTRTRRLRLWLAPPLGVIRPTSTRRTKTATSPMSSPRWEWKSTFEIRTTSGVRAELSVSSQRQSPRRPRSKSRCNMMAGRLIGMRSLPGRAYELPSCSLIPSASGALLRASFPRKLRRRRRLWRVLGEQLLPALSGRARCVLECLIRLILDVPKSCCVWSQTFLFSPSHRRHCRRIFCVPLRTTTVLGCTMVDCACGRMKMLWKRWELSTLRSNLRTSWDRMTRPRQESSHPEQWKLDRC